jgi:hypothetical protein
MSRAEIEAVMKMKPSAYRSMLMGKLGLTKKSKKGRASLCRWGNQKKGEKWINLTALLTDKKVLPCGKKGERQKELGWPSVCRPSVRVNAKTPTLAREFSKAQIKKAIKIKQEGKVIRWNLL